MGKVKNIFIGIGVFILILIIFQIILHNVFLFSKQDKIVMPEEHDDYVTVSVLTEEFEKGVVFRIRNLINVVTGRGSEIEVLNILNDVWSEKTDKYPHFAWEKLKLPIVKVEISSVLLQSHINRRIDIDYEKVHSYVSSMMSNADPDVVSQAIGALTIPDNPEDVEKIFNIAQKEDARTFKSAVHTLSYMCNEFASKALLNLKDNVSDKNKKYVEEMTSEAVEYKSRSGWCEGRAQI